MWVLEVDKAVDVGNQSSPLLFSWFMWAVWVLEVAKAVDVPSVSVVVVATAKKTKIDTLAVVFILTPEQRYWLYEIGLT